MSGTGRPCRRKCLENSRKATFSSRTSYRMPIALSFSLASRMILRPEPPSSPCSGCIRPTGEWKCCSKSLLRTSMNTISSDPVLTNHRNELFSSIADSQSRDLVDGEFQRNHRTAKERFHSQPESARPNIRNGAYAFCKSHVRCQPCCRSHYKDNMGATG